MGSSSLRIDDCWNRIGVQGDCSCPELERHVHCRNCPVYSAAARTMLERDAPAGYLAERTLHFAQVPAIEEASTRSALAFRIGVEWLALATVALEEIAAQSAIHSLPHQRNGLVRGVVNVRGELLVCISLGVLLGMGDELATTGNSTGAQLRRLLVAGRDGNRLVFPVDEVEGVERYHPRELRPATATRSAAAYTTGVLSRRGRAIGCLDDRLLFDTLNRSLT